MPKANRKGMALSLSGGGYRATLFHAGALLRINELGLLRNIQRLVSVSGGSIALGCLAMEWPSLRWEHGRATNLFDRVAVPLMRLCGRTIDLPSIIEGTIRSSSAAEILRRAYRRHLFGDVELHQIPARPTFIFQATNLSTGRAFRFYRDYVADYLIGSAPSNGITLAKAVAASSAFPPLLSPLVLKFPAGSFKKLPGASLHDLPRYTRVIPLVDGGVYDNLGLESAWDSEVVLVSDAGAPFHRTPEPELTWYGQATRALEIATDQSRGLRRRWLIDQFVRGARRGAYWGLATEVRALAGAVPRVNRKIQDRLGGIRTRLSRFTPEEQGQLTNLGYALADASLRSRLSNLPDVEFRFPDPVNRIG